jgi:undecaprenyl pyrophosphate synthase
MSVVDRLFQRHLPRTRDILQFFPGRELYGILRFLENIPEAGIYDSLRQFILDFPRFTALVIFSGIITYSGFDAIEDYHHWLLATPKRIMSSLKMGLYQYTPIAGENRKLRIGIIPDGNRRWAKEKSLTSAEGHFFGSARIIDIVKTATIIPSISHLVIYILSYDNFQKRSAEEQGHLLEILEKWIDELRELDTDGKIRLRIVGEPDERIRQILPDDATSNGDDGILQVSLLVCYDGRREILQAGGDPDKMWIQDEIDAVIRTGGTHRASGFCTFQTAYADWFFDDRMWPDITPAIFYEYLAKIQHAVSLQNHGR